MGGQEEEEVGCGTDKLSSNIDLIYSTGIGNSVIIM